MPARVLRQEPWGAIQTAGSNGNSRISGRLLKSQVRINPAPYRLQAAAIDSKSAPVPSTPKQAIPSTPAGKF